MENVHKWDTEITGNLRKEFLQWFQDLKILEEIHISRWINATAENLKHSTIHTFCDANKEPYAAVVFLRLEEEDVKLSLLAAKSRIDPLRGGTIPRMELLATLTIEVDSGPLPENRVRDAAVFQITGVDAAGPLFLIGNQKAWVLLFTCAVYRAVHLELITSLSTEAFFMGFRRFVARCGRCSTIYCDNGTNFVGTANILHGLDGNKIIRHGAVNAIDWKFNPPTAAWWGG
ncbi:hypothetical protein AVEN_14512-1 [Araneus ventricosus]|uniref:Integrase catalytic domain-containing protein n=1 Tax=Araneus ventricosus TaxID=182803 RepID=A0A4Y2CGX6_ARAVE|nr:hypothetical protein AVEN_14512-1 [Araneus ventricosus]